MTLFEHRAGFVHWHATQVELTECAETLAADKARRDATLATIPNTYGDPEEPSRDHH